MSTLSNLFASSPASGQAPASGSGSGSASGSSTLTSLKADVGLSSSASASAPPPSQASFASDIGFPSASASAPAKADTNLHALDFSEYVPDYPTLTRPWNYLGMGAVSGIQQSTEYMANVLWNGRDNDGNSLQIGSRFFVPSGTCDTTTSDKACAGQQRYLYFDSVPTNRFPCDNPTQPVDPTSVGTFPQGLLSGVVDTAVKSNPFELIASTLGEGSLVNNTCVKLTKPANYVVAPYGKGTAPEYVTRCTAPEMPLVCGLAQNTVTTCTPYKPVDAMKAFNDIVRGLVKETATLVNPDATPDTYPPFQTSYTSFPPLDKNDSLWHTLCGLVEERLLMAANKLPGAENVDVRTKGRCMVSKLACGSNSTFRPGWYFYEWVALHGFVNMPGAVAINHGQGCASVPTATACNTGTQNAVYCQWEAVGKCSTRIPTVQVYWVGYINKSTREVLVNPTLFNTGIGNPPESFEQLPPSTFSAMTTNTGAGSATPGPGGSEGFAGDVAVVEPTQHQSQRSPQRACAVRWWALCACMVVVCVFAWVRWWFALTA